MNTNDAGGTLGYSFEKDCYYIMGTKANGSSRGYYYDGVAENFAIDVNIETVAIDSVVKNVPGLVLSTGTNRMELKASPYDGSKNALYVNIGRDSNLGELEIALTGFSNTVSMQGGQMKFTAVRYDNVLLLYNESGKLLTALSSRGIVCYNGCSVSATSEKYNAFVARLAVFFANVNKENAIGVVTHWTGDAQGTSYFDMDWNTSEDYIKANYIDKLEVYEFTPVPDGDYTISVSGVKIGKAYLVGAPITLTLKFNDGETIASQIALVYGDTTEYVNGAYNLTTKRTTFEFKGKAGLTDFSVSKTATLAYATISGDLSGLFDDGGKLTVAGTTSYGAAFVEDWTDFVGDDGTFAVENVPSGDYELMFVVGDEKHFKLFTLEEDDFVINADDFVREPIKLGRQGGWTDSNFIRGYSEEDGV